MSYVVNWRGSDGQAGWHPVGELPEAASQVEHLRNSEGVSEIKIFKLEEIAFEFRQYFRVELASAVAEETTSAFAVPAAPTPVSEAPADPPAWAPEPAVESAPVFEPSAPGDGVLAEVGADEGASNGQRRGLFGR